MVLSGQRKPTCVVSDGGDPVAESRMSFSIEVPKFTKLWTFGVDWQLRLEVQAPAEESPEEVERSPARSPRVEKKSMQMAPRNAPVFANPFYGRYAYNALYYR